MEELNELISRFVGSNYVKQSEDAIRRRGKLIRILIESKRLPVTGWDSVTIEWFLQQVALMDSNNFLGNVGAGEREGRVYSDIIQRRYVNLFYQVLSLKFVQAFSYGSWYRAIRRYSCDSAEGCGVFSHI